MHGEDNLRLTSSEISVVWSSYLNNSLSICIMNSFLTNVDDLEIKSALEFARKIAQKNLQISKELLEEGKQPIPVGFTEEDVNLAAPRLYSDAFYLYYLKNMAKVGLSVYGVALATAAHPDVRNFLGQAIQASVDLYNKTANTLLSKGLFVKPPYVSTPDSVDFVNKKSYLGGILNLNQDNRALNVIEITHIEANTETNSVGSALLAGFAQVAKAKKVRNYCTIGKEISKKHIQVFTSMLTDGDVPAPMPWDLEVTNSTTAPFSDKLIMFHTNLLIASSISNYATASAASFREDIIASYIRLSAEVFQYAKNGLDIMIKNEWLEQPPQTPNHKQMAKD